MKSQEGTSATKTEGYILQNVNQETLKDLLVVKPNEKALIKFNDLIDNALGLLQKNM